MVCLPPVYNFEANKIGGGVNSLKIVGSTVVSFLQSTLKCSLR